MPLSRSAWRTAPRDPPTATRPGRSLACTPGRGRPPSRRCRLPCRSAGCGSPRSSVPRRSSRNGAAAHRHGGSGSRRGLVRIGPTVGWTPEGAPGSVFRRATPVIPRLLLALCEPRYQSFRGVFGVGVPTRADERIAQGLEFGSQPGPRVERRGEVLRPSFLLGDAGLRRRAPAAHGRTPPGRARCTDRSRRARRAAPRPPAGG